jgi:hypothetical protein
MIHHVIQQPEHRVDVIAFLCRDSSLLALLHVLDAHRDAGLQRRVREIL